MTLDDLLERDRSYPTLDPAARTRARDRVIAAAHRDVARRARVVRLRRHGRLLVGLTVAALVGVVVVDGWGSSSPQSATGSARSGTRQSAPPVTRTVQFTTVAQVVDAASSVSQAVDPAAAPYWKVVRSWPCPPLIKNPPANGQCKATTWWGNGRPGVDVEERHVSQIPANTVTFHGKTLTWRQVNARTWSQTQLAAIVADGRPPTMPATQFVFGIASGFLAEAPASAVIRQQLWHLLAGLPGVSLAGRAKDSLGRPGWLLTLTMPDWPTESILVDTNTGRLLAINGNGASPTGPNAYTVVSAGPTNTAPTPRS